MNKFRLFVVLLWGMVLTACGGGGTPGVDPNQPVKPVLTVQILSSAKTVASTIDNSGGFVVQATVKDSTGKALAGQVVTLTVDATKVALASADGTALTDANGVATVGIAPVSLYASGAGTVGAAATVNATALTASANYQVSAAKLVIQTLNLGSGALAASGSRAIYAVVTVDGVAANRPSATVNFAATCGNLSSHSVSTDATGTASTTFSDAGCGGSGVTVTASVVGATTVSGVLTVLPIAASNLNFVSASPARIYLAGAMGANQSQLNFKLLDAQGNGLAGQAIQLALSDASLGASVGTLGNAAPVTLTTDSQGNIFVPVYSGNLPGTVRLTATLVSNPGVSATSSLISIAPGIPVQSRTSLASSIYALEGWNLDGTTAQLTVSLADRLGGPVPDGVQVNFSTQGGVVVPASCVTAGGTSQCSVNLRSGNPRPTNGRVSVLAYAVGEEDFVDLNGNGIYDAGEPFTDLGNAYRDDNQNNQWDAGEFAVARAGSVACAGGPNGRANTCDGVWGAADVRSQIVVTFSTSQAFMATTSVSTSAIVFTLSDLNGVSMPSGTTIAATVRAPSTCTVGQIIPTAVPNTTLVPLQVSILFQAATGCAHGNIVDITATSPSGVVTLYTVTL